MKKDAFSLFYKNFRLKAVVAFVLALSLLFCGCSSAASDPTEPSTEAATTQTTASDETAGTEGTTETTGPASDEGSQPGTSQNSGGQTNSQTGTGSQPDTQTDTGSQSNSQPNTGSQSSGGVGKGKASPVSLSSIPSYSGNPYVAVDGNVPNFSAAELTSVGYESYSSLDSLGRVGVAVASVGKDTMPAAGEERDSISNIYPTGWVQAKYSCVSGGWLYNRCHLIGWQLSAENDNKANLITGTQYLNIKGMLPFENQVADYIKETGNHVAYRVTPIYNGNDLVAAGVQVEAYSVEDNGEICFNVFCYNVQPEITIDYATGASTGSANESNNGNSSGSASSGENSSQTVYITATGKKYHSTETCFGLSKAKAIYDSTLEEALEKGLEPCKICY